MKILLLGKNGQVGWELQRALAPLGTLISLDRSQLNLSDADALRYVIRQHKPDWLVNAAAYTAVDKAETDQANAYAINAEALAVMAQEIFNLGAWLLHYSTDYVFDGNKEGFYKETEEVNPLSIYGKSKLAGERSIIDSGCNHLIFRTSWVYATRGANFAKSMLRLFAEREQLNIVADQQGAPTSAELIADVSALCLRQIAQAKDTDPLDLSGIYHLVAKGATTWFDYAEYILSKAKEGPNGVSIQCREIHPIPSSAYPVAATRPLNSKLCVDKIEQAFGVVLSEWHYHCDRMLQEVLFR
ncbi:MAG: dTDP-4-dehydrorhamnose reductase [Gammaproteobacteria bacterium CG22_combo_CG10-13_8_21_14_all_40_8]|nr:MAG: dTDP-4-dehydrorhamnose reductase [Gammaproteobacteria bacterium CG22_combo_CG10-13_8_21_14_all_40_8]